MEFVTGAVTLCVAYVHTGVGASVIVSKFSDRLNDARGAESIRAASARAAKLGNIGESTLYPYFRAEHPRPTTPVVVALSAALNIPIRELRELADIPAEGEPWMPPAESRLMNDRQRRAVTELIRSFVQAQGADNAVPSDSPTPAGTPSQAPEGEEDGLHQPKRRGPMGTFRGPGLTGEDAGEDGTDEADERHQL